MVVLEVLSQRLKEKPELSEFEEVRAVFVSSGRCLLGVVEGPVDGVLAVEQFVALEDITHSSINLKGDKCNLNAGPDYKN